MKNITDQAVSGMAATLSTDPLLNDKQVEDLTGVAAGTLRWWRHQASQGHDAPGPKWFRLGPKAIRYRRSDVEAWVEEHYAKAGV
jgi:predicted DNA-binding transcriptional regulator AlpA